ncbi:MAG: bifunctional diaminohydroxyphosphoribosylaminopyrimidine deaminase/5-amino-6-(5-phosphoribosylamino)uracil reductase RibD [Planctomycetaceae bacterium]|nr:bifunctional diaminohydroxyphosphoribosylaminopyrimidine deaminase/5-amino-6-(5-phosphoribosylamino)uracil reductase RibD [Planctomycetaceae bacterium]
MRHALVIAAQGIGHVEPNPAVGSVLVDRGLNLIAEGFHQHFGGPHAEANALAAAGDKARGATLFVTLEPCCHHGKTPPCSRALITAGVERVVVAMQDPAPHVAGGGIAELRAAGIDVEVGLCEPEARRLVAPFVTLVTLGRPFVHAKWAMTLDGKIATRTGHSKWISNRGSRELVHRLRGRMDAIIVGAGTALADDPLLTARPPGPRTPTRIVVDARGVLPIESQLARTATESPVLLATTAAADEATLDALRQKGVESILLPSREGRGDLSALLAELGRRRMTNVLIEGGGALLGSFFDAQLIDEVHVFMAPKLVGGSAAVSPIGGDGLEQVPELSQLDSPSLTLIESDVYVNGRLRRR